MSYYKCEYCSKQIKTDNCMKIWYFGSRIIFCCLKCAKEWIILKRGGLKK